jgi:prepilin-type N-terminal cleavage/methylation domain-containing protein
MSIQPDRPRAFTLVELLVVIGIIALLIGILLPALMKARHAALSVNCLSNMRSMEIAHWMYMTEHDGWFIDVGLPHGGAHQDEEIAWINTLEQYYGSRLLHRSPLDNSPHWGPFPDGAPIPSANPEQRRLSSYGVNDFLTGIGPMGKRFVRLGQVRQASNVVHFVYMAETGEYAGSDHIHADGWRRNNPAEGWFPAVAATQIQTNAHGGPKSSWDSRTVYGFLDGRAEVLSFRQVYRDPLDNNFDPTVAR